jgi:hypothetical protein
MDKEMANETTLRALLTVGLLSLSILPASPASAFQSNSGATTSKSKDKAMKQTDTVKRESPFACNVAGISAERRPRYMALAKKLVGAKQEIRELEDGYAFRFATDESTIQDLAEFIMYERQCCPFFDLEMVVEREGGPAWLRLRGRDGVKEFIRTEFGIK